MVRPSIAERRRLPCCATCGVTPECIGKGKARTRFEFGCKVSRATTTRPAPGGQFVIGARTLPGNPFDGHTLAARIAQTERLTGVAVKRDHRGHDADRQRVFVSGQKRGVTPIIRREIRRRAGVEPVIGHLGRNFFAGPTGTGHNLRLLRAWLIRLLAFLIGLLAISGPAPPLPSAQLAAR